MTDVGVGQGAKGAPENPGSVRRRQAGALERFLRRMECYQRSREPEQSQEAAVREIYREV